MTISDDEIENQTGYQQAHDRGDGQLKQEQSIDPLGRRGSLLRNQWDLSKHLRRLQEPRTKNQEPRTKLQVGNGISVLGIWLLEISFSRRQARNRNVPKTKRVIAPARRTIA